MRSDVRAIRRRRIFLCTLYFFPESPMTKHRSTSTKETATLLQRNKKPRCTAVGPATMATVSYSSLPGQTHPSAGWIFQQSNARTVTDYRTEKERQIRRRRGKRCGCGCCRCRAGWRWTSKGAANILRVGGDAKGDADCSPKPRPASKNRRGGHDEGEHRPRRTQTHSGDGHVPRGAWWWRQRMLMLRTWWTRPRWFRFRRP